MYIEKCSSHHPKTNALLQCIAHKGARIHAFGLSLKDMSSFEIFHLDLILNLCFIKFIELTAYVHNCYVIDSVY